MVELQDLTFNELMMSIIPSALKLQPSSIASGHVNLDGREYVRLANVNGVLAVWRVRNDGMLKRLKRWPAELEDW